MSGPSGESSSSSVKHPLFDHSLRRSCRFVDHPVFTSLDFALFYTEQGRPVLRQSHNLEDQVSVFMSPSDRVAQLYPQAVGSIFVAYYDSQGCGGGILTPLSTRNLNLLCEVEKCLSLTGFNYKQGLL
jgi:hypothetical protein